ncbi:MAG: aminopeptidase P family protein [Holdemanella sp.]|nr:aminopeptidase P family protein [Holdemanella sp.]
MIKQRLENLRKEMKKEGVHAYIIPTSDFHETEQVATYFQARKWMSGFTGSAGVLVVLLDKAALWTDGRYFIQAPKELKGSTIELMKAGMEGTPTIVEYITSNLKEGMCVGFDGRTINANDARKYEQAFGFHGLSLKVDEDLVGRIWTDRPAMPCAKTFYYDEKYSGRTINEKLEMVRKEMKLAYANSYVITKIDEIAWLFNIRAQDIEHVPLPLSYATVTLQDATLYINQSRLDAISRAKLVQANVCVKDYMDIYEDCMELKGPVLVDPSSANSKIVFSIKEKLVEMQSPVILLKARKNEVELASTRIAHIKDGVAVTKFMYWLKKNIGKVEMTEYSAALKLHEFRAQQPNFFDDSFSTIPAYGANAAMMHYHATEEDCATLKPEGFFLVDSGGHFFEGTTDITRTFVLGPTTEEERIWFTRALRSHIRLAKANFLFGCKGFNLDILSRGPLWDYDMDYQCGTGHGVGHLSNVHECPNGFRWRIVPERNDSCVLEEGMIQSNEPGVYIEGVLGIRHENEYVVQKGNKNHYGQFMHLECLTFVPFDREAIDPSLMNQDEIEWLNNYHKECVEKLSYGLEEDELDWLKEICKPL